MRLTWWIQYRPCATWQSDFSANKTSAAGPASLLLTISSFPPSHVCSLPAWSSRRGPLHQSSYIWLLPPPSFRVCEWNNNDLICKVLWETQPKANRQYQSASHPRIDKCLQLMVRWEERKTVGIYPYSIFSLFSTRSLKWATKNYVHKRHWGIQLQITIISKKTSHFSQESADKQFWKDICEIKKWLSCCISCSDSQVKTCSHVFNNSQTYLQDDKLNSIYMFWPCSIVCFGLSERTNHDIIH